jgi:hypothetical protein
VPAQSGQQLWLRSGTKERQPGLFGGTRRETVTTETERPNLSTEHQKKGDALRPSDTLDKGQKNEETVPRKTSLSKNE